LCLADAIKSIAAMPADNAQNVTAIAKTQRKP